MHHGIATAIASDFRIADEIARNFRSEKPIWPSFIAKRIATATVSLPQKIASWNLDKLVGTTCSYSNTTGPAMKPSKNRCVQFWPRKRIVDFDCKSSPGDGALRCWNKKVPVGNSGSEDCNFILWDWPRPDEVWLKPWETCQVELKGWSWGLPWPFPKISCEFCLCVFLSPAREGNTLTSLTPCSRNPNELLMLIGSLVLRIIAGRMVRRMDMNFREGPHEPLSLVTPHRQVLGACTGTVPSSRDLLHIKFENLNICNGHVNVTKINSKPKFPVTFT